MSPIKGFATGTSKKWDLLRFAGNQTRPDITALCWMASIARYASTPNLTHMDAVDRIFTCIKTIREEVVCSDNRYGLRPQGIRGRRLPDVKLRR